MKEFIKYTAATIIGSWIGSTIANKYGDKLASAIEDAKEKANKAIESAKSKLNKKGEDEKSGEEFPDVK